MWCLPNTQKDVGCPSHIEKLRYQNDVFLHLVDLTKEYRNTGRPEYILMLSFNKNEMGGACSRYGGEKRCIQGFGGEA